MKHHFTFTALNDEKLLVHADHILIAETMPRADVHAGLGLTTTRIHMPFNLSVDVKESVEDIRLMLGGLL